MRSGSGGGLPGKGSQSSGTSARRFPSVTAGAALALSGIWSPTAGTQPVVAAALAKRELVYATVSGLPVATLVKGEA